MSKNNSQEFKKWLDIRNHDFIRVASISPTIHLANPKKNAEEHLKLFNIVYKQGAQIAIATECGITGYSIWDLVDSETLVEGTQKAIEDILIKTKDMNMLLVLGAYLNIGSSRFNCAIVSLKGKILGVIPKSYLASSGEFRDERWVTPGLGITNKNISLAGQDNIPFGVDLLFKSNAIKHFVFFVQICQDLWVPIPPSTIASLNGATVCATINASPEIIGKEDYQRVMNSYLSASTYSLMMYSSSGIGESSTDLVFGGRMIIAQNNHVLVSRDRFDGSGEQYAVADGDLYALVHERRNDPSFQASMKESKRDFREVLFEGMLGTANTSVYDKFINHSFPKLPFVPNNPDRRFAVCERILEMQVCGVERRLEALPTNDKRLIVAVSGGADSAESLVVAARTMDKMNFPRKNVVAVTMPGFGTSDQTFELATRLMKTLGVTTLEIPIGDVAELTLKKIGHDLRTQDLTFENSQAWARKYIEWMLASFVDPKGERTTRGIVLGTGDLSELILGWCTFAGDQMSHYNPNGNIPKTLIWFMLETLSEIYENSDPKLSKVLLEIRHLQPSPELLRPAKNGKFHQLSEDKNGKYVFQDFNIYHMMRWGDGPFRLARKMYDAYDHNLELTEIVKWLDVLFSKFLPSQFKRSTLPDGVLIGTVGVSPRDKFKIPSDAQSAVWKEELIKIPLK